MADYGMGTVRKRNGTYHIDVQIGGKRYRESAKTTSITEARAYLQRRIAEIRTEQLQPFLQITVNQLLDDLDADYVLRSVGDMVAVRAHMKAVRNALGHLSTQSITDDHVTRFIQDRLSAGRANGTVNREIGLLSRAFRLGMESGKTQSMPRIRRLPERNVRQGFFEPEEIEQLISFLPDYLKDFVRFAHCSGWRKGEIASLTWDCVDSGLQTVRLRPESSKNGAGRVLALTGELHELFKRRRDAKKRSPYVFHRNGQPIVSIRRAWATATKKAGLEGRLFHDLRRSAIRDMVRAGVPEKVAMSISGHKTRAIFDRYNIVHEEDIRQAMSRTEQYRATR